MSESQRNLIKAIRDAVDFPAFVEATTGPLRRQPHGRPTMALCPWQDGGRTPSPAVYADLAYCCSRGWHVDALDCLMRREDLTSPQALAELARQSRFSARPVSQERERAAQARWCIRRELERRCLLPRDPNAGSAVGEVRDGCQQLERHAALGA
jgi:hypothetical protein